MRGRFKFDIKKFIIFVTIDCRRGETIMQSQRHSGRFIFKQWTWRPLQCLSTGVCGCIEFENLDFLGEQIYGK